MRPTIVVVGDILPQNGAKVPLVNNDHVIQALSTECAYYPFGDGVRFGSPNRGEYRFDAQPSAALNQLSASSVSECVFKTQRYLTDKRSSER